MSQYADLPSFGRPPVNEVVLGVQFGAPILTTVHLGLYHSMVRNEFPTFQDAPPLPPIGFQPGPTPYSVGLSPRGWFSSLDDTALIQLQSNRLVFNWKSGLESATYPHYPAVKSAFQEAYSKLSELCKSEKLGSITPNGCEVYYVNSLPEKSTGIPTGYPEQVFMPWSGKMGEEWIDHPIEDLSFTSRYPLLNREGKSVGKLSLAVGSGQSPDGSGGFFSAQLMAQGTPLKPNLAAVLDFFDIAHEAIVRCFTAATTPRMHEIWKRLA